MDCYLFLKHFFLFAVLAEYFVTVESVYCYVCTSKELKTCGYQFMMDKHEENYVTWCTTSCYKLSTQRRDREVISRGCVPEMKTIDWCRHDKKGDVKGVMCTCNDDYCNVTSGVQLCFTVVLFAILCNICHRIWSD